MNTAAVIGGGLAGTGLALRLARAGRQTVLLERERGPHDKVCGEFLSQEAARALEDLGLDLAALGAQPIARVSLCIGARRIDVRLPFKAFSLSRRILDEALLREAAAAGVDVRRGVRVTGLEGEEGRWTVQADGVEPVVASQAFLATGKHDLRGWRRPAKDATDFIGFKLHLRLAPVQAAALAGAVELHLFPGGYAGLQPVEDEQANLCLVARKPAFQAAGGHWRGLLARLLDTCPQLAERLDGSLALLARPLAVSAIPYGHVRSRSDGVWRLGDQAAVIPSFAGEGMSIALRSAEMAADFALAGRGPEVFQPALARHVAARVKGAAMVSDLLVRGWMQPVIGAALSAAPGLASLVARATRLPRLAVLTSLPLIPANAGTQIVKS